LPQQNGRARGFAYAEFNDRQSLIDALTYNGDMFRNRQLRVGLPGDNGILHKWMSFYW
jgi:RNA recognition motif-containing protein